MKGGKVQREFYKVVVENFGKLVSYIFYIPRMTVVYKVGEWVRPKIENTRLFVFDSFASALEATKLQGGIAIYKCEATDPVPIKFVVKPPYITLQPDPDLKSEEPGKLSKKFLDYWEKKKFEVDEGEYSAECPAGTLGVTAVKLLEQLKS